jgi:hypothetical protein
MNGNATEAEALVAEHTGNNEAECHYCGARIFLVAHGLHYKWQTNAAKADASWHCNTDPAFPVRGHAPKQQFDDSARHGADDEPSFRPVTDPAVLARAAAIVAAHEAHKGAS